MTASWRRALLCLCSGVCLALHASAAVGADLEALRKKLDLVSYYLDSATSSRIRESDNRRAQDLLARAIRLREEAGKALADGDMALAAREIGLALQSISAAGTALTRGTQTSEELARRNAALRDEIAAYRDSFDQTVLTKGPEYASLLDRARLDALLARADTLSVAGRHEEAAEPLQEAYRLTVDAVTRLRRNDTVVYSLEFRTPADEYRYEEKRHQSFALLAHQLMSSGAASGSREAPVHRFLEQASRLAEQARHQAARGAHAQAIKTMEEANGSMVRALQTMGLAIPG